MNTVKEPLAYSIPEAVAACNVSRSVMYEEMAAGRLRYGKIGRRTFILRDDLSDWLARHLVPTTAQGKRS